ncbi:MAG: AAA family ATPase [Candidatus Nanoarchaeia archaeon]|nr:AAA family ATPase [Candidatus Jingweiarchaeum tengchongense]
MSYRQELVEKYRPRKFDEVIGQEHVIKSLREMIARKTKAHLLFVGPPGCGKTSVAYAYANEIGLPIVELNASDERGISTIREKVKVLAYTMVEKIILLDEADMLTEESQHALRRIMEKSVSTFILTANEEWRLIEPIKSRCVIFHFRKLSLKETASVIINVLKKEGVKFEVSEEFRNALYGLIEYSDGDLRKTLKTLEQMITKDMNITVENIKLLIPPKIASEIIKLCYEGKFEEGLRKLEDILIMQNFDGRLLSKQFFEAIGETELPIHVKLRLYERLGEVERGIKIGCNPLIQFAGFLATCYASIISVKRDE